MDAALAELVGDAAHTHTRTVQISDRRALGQRQVARMRRLGRCESHRRIVHRLTRRIEDCAPVAPASGARRRNLAAWLTDRLADSITTAPDRGHVDACWVRGMCLLGRLGDPRYESCHAVLFAQRCWAGGGT